MDQAGLVAIAMAGLWIAYLVPHRLRYRQQLLDSCHDDRFSERLRVVRVATPLRASLPAQLAAGQVVRVQLHRSRPVPEPGRHGHGGGLMERPHATRDRVVADAARRSAAEHAQRAAHLARRSAGARRRAVLTLVLLVAVAAGWTAVGVAGAALVTGAAPTVLLAGVLTLGRLAVLAGGRADAEWRAGAATRAPLPTSLSSSAARVTGRAVRPSDAATEVMARISEASVERRSAAASAAAATAAAATAASAVAGPPAARAAAADDPATQEGTTAARGEQDGTWAPVPVPRPAYTLKPSARRQEPAPLDLDVDQQSAGTGQAVAAATLERADDVAAVLDPSAPVPVPKPVSSTADGGIDLDAVLARRRASGE